MAPDGQPATSASYLKPGTPVRIVGLTKSAQHNGKVGRVTAAKAAQEGRVGVKLRDGTKRDGVVLRDGAEPGTSSTTLAVRRENLEVLELPGSAPTMVALPPPPPRTGGSWDDLGEQQLQLAISDEERAVVGRGRTGPSLQAALCEGAKTGTLRIFANAPRYDQLFVSATQSDAGLGSANYVVEAGLDEWEGTAWWTTTDHTEPSLAEQGLVRIDAAALESEYGGVLTFLDGCRRLGAPRYTMKTVLDPEAKPHVIAMVEKVLAASPLRILLAEACEAPPA